MRKEQGNILLRAIHPFGFVALQTNRVDSARNVVVETDGKKHKLRHYELRRATKWNDLLVALQCTESFVARYQKLLRKLRISFPMDDWEEVINAVQGLVCANPVSGLSAAHDLLMRIWDFRVEQACGINPLRLVSSWNDTLLQMIVNQSLTKMSPDAHLAQAAGSVVRSNQICNLYNADACRYQYCKYRHVCKNCGESHPASKCPKNGPAAEKKGKNPSPSPEKGGAMK
jgi:hypothetical protein